MDMNNPGSIIALAIFSGAGTSLIGFIAARIADNRRERARARAHLLGLASRFHKEFNGQWHLGRFDKGENRARSAGIELLRELHFIAPVSDPQKLTLVNSLSDLLKTAIDGQMYAPLTSGQDQIRDLIEKREPLSKEPTKHECLAALHVAAEDFLNNF